MTNPLTPGSSRVGASVNGARRRVLLSLTEAEVAALVEVVDEALERWKATLCRPAGGCTGGDTTRVGVAGRHVQRLEEIRSQLRAIEREPDEGAAIWALE